MVAARKKPGPTKRLAMQRAGGQGRVVERQTYLQAQCGQPYAGEMFCTTSRFTQHRADWRGVTILFAIVRDLAVQRLVPDMDFCRW